MNIPHPVSTQRDTINEKIVFILLIPELLL